MRGRVAGGRTGRAPAGMTDLGKILVGFGAVMLLLGGISARSRAASQERCHGSADCPETSTSSAAAERPTSPRHLAPRLDRAHRDLRASSVGADSRAGVVRGARSSPAGPARSRPATTSAWRSPTACTPSSWAAAPWRCSDLAGRPLIGGHPTWIRAWERGAGLGGSGRRPPGVARRRPCAWWPRATAAVRVGERLPGRGRARAEPAMASWW